VRSKKVLGSIVAESIKCAYKLVGTSEKAQGNSAPSQPQQQQADSQAQQPQPQPQQPTPEVHSPPLSIPVPSPDTACSGCFVHGSSVESALIGVSRIWVHTSFRKQGIATAMLDVARSHFVFGQVVKKEQVALTQPL